MPTARRWKRAALWPIVALAAVSSGCRWIPVRRGDTKGETPPPMLGHADPATTGDQFASTSLPPLPPLRSVDDDEAFRPSRTTPLLDAAAERDTAIKSALALELESRETSPKNRIEIHTVSTAPVPSEKEPVPVEPVAPAKADPEVAPATFGPPKPVVDVPPISAQQEPDVAPPITEAPAPVESDESTLWDSVLTALATAESGPIAEPPALPVTLTPLPPVPEFAIADLRLCKRVVGFGRTEALSSPVCKPGQSVLLYCELDGLRDEETPDGFRACLSSHVAIIPAAGGTPVWSENLGKSEDVCRRRRRDFFVNYRLILPENLAPGVYEVRLTQKDLLGDREASRSVEMTVGR